MSVNFYLTVLILLVIFITSCMDDKDLILENFKSDSIPESLLKADIRIINTCDTLCSAAADFRSFTLDDEYIEGKINRSYPKNYNLNFDSFPGLRLHRLIEFVSKSYKLKEAQVWYKNCAGVSIINGVVFIHKIEEKLDYSLIVCLDTLEYMRIPVYKWDDDTSHSLERTKTDLAIYGHLLNSRLYSVRQVISGKPVYVPDAKK